MLHPGDQVVFRMHKYTSHPGPRAAAVSPDQRGEKYAYDVDKFWVVAETRKDGKLVLLTRRGKQHLVDATDPRLRPARWWERLFRRQRFPVLARLGYGQA